MDTRRQLRPVHIFIASTFWEDIAMVAAHIPSLSGWAPKTPTARALLGGSTLTRRARAPVPRLSVRIKAEEGPKEGDQGGSSEQNGDSGSKDAALREKSKARLMGLLTDRAAKTLVYYLMETNLSLHTWLYSYLAENPIPKEGAWSDVSGENFLRKLLGSPLETHKYSFNGRDEMFSCAGPIGVDPRSIAQRIMDIRAQIAKEWLDELSLVSEENALLMRETVLSSFAMQDLPVTMAPGAAAHPELACDSYGPDDSAGGSDD